MRKVFELKNLFASFFWTGKFDTFFSQVYHIFLWLKFIFFPEESSFLLSLSFIVNLSKLESKTLLGNFTSRGREHTLFTHSDATEGVWKSFWWWHFNCKPSVFEAKTILNPLLSETKLEEYLKSLKKNLQKNHSWQENIHLLARFVLTTWKRINNYRLSWQLS